MNVRNLDKCKKLRFSTCLMLAGKRLSSRTEIWRRTIRQYLIAPSAGMNYSPADNGAWCTNRHTERSEEIPLCLKLFYFISLHTFILRRSERKIKSFQRILEILNGSSLWRAFYERVGALQRSFILNVTFLKREWSVNQYQSPIAATRNFLAACRNTCYVYL